VEVLESGVLGLIIPFSSDRIFERAFNRFLSVTVMPARLFYDKDCSLEALRDKTIVFIGYGNQGRAQALNLVSAEQHRDAAALLLHFYVLSPTMLDGANY